MRQRSWKSQKVVEISGGSFSRTSAGKKKKDDDEPSASHSDCEHPSPEPKPSYRTIVARTFFIFSTLPPRGRARLVLPLPSQVPRLGIWGTRSTRAAPLGLPSLHLSPPLPLRLLLVGTVLTVSTCHITEALTLQLASITSAAPSFHARR